MEIKEFVEIVMERVKDPQHLYQVYEVHKVQTYIWIAYHYQKSKYIGLLPINDQFIGVTFDTREQENQPYIETAVLPLSIFGQEGWQDHLRNALKDAERPEEDHILQMIEHYKNRITNSLHWMSRDLENLDMEYDKLKEFRSMKK